MIFFENILICIAIPLLVILPFVQKDTRRFCMALMTGMLFCLLGAYLNSFFGILYDMNAMETARYIAPIVEEIMRMAPVLLFLLLMHPSDKELLGFGTAVGAGFATFENCCYITQNGAQMIKFILIRGLAVGVLHVVCGLIVGFGLCLVRQYWGVMISGIIGTFSFAVSIHALYNLLVSVEGTPTYIGFCVPVITLALVYQLWEHTKEEE